MPLGKYYCDYCDKEFQDTPYARKRHLVGIQHLRAKALWYDSLNLQDPSQPYADGILKGVCNRFVKTGYCQYGDSCKYFHPKSLQNASAPQGSVAGFAGSTESNTVLGNQSNAPGFSTGNMLQDSMGVSWGNLPPSLKPPPEGGYPHLPLVDWG